MAAKQLGFFFFVWLLLHNNVTPSALSHWTEKPASLSFSPQFSCFFSFPRLSLFYWGSQILFARSKWLCVQRQRERRNAWETDRDAGGVGEFFFFCWGGQAEWRWAVVMSHLLQADRMARESWHVPPSWKQGEDRETSKWGGNYFSIEAHL